MSVRRIDARGYVRIGGEFEHRLVMQSLLGRRLRSQEHVHHRDGNRQNNDPGNLEIVVQASHIAHHNRIRPRRKKGVVYPGDRAALERRRQRSQKRYNLMVRQFDGATA